MAALPLVSFDPSPWACSVVLVVFSHVDDAGDFWAVVGAEEDEGVLVEFEFFESLLQLADDPVHLEDEVTVWPRLCFAFEGIGGEGGEVD